MDDVSALKNRIEQLEQVLLELAPFGACHEVLVNATLAGKDDEAATRRGQMFKRDTLYLSKHIYRKVVKLIEPRLREAGMDYIFERV